MAYVLCECVSIGEVAQPVVDWVLFSDTCTLDWLCV